MSEGLWVAEGFTQYYGNLILMRAGLETENDFLKRMAGLINTKANTPGGQNYSPIENSQRAVFVDAGVSIDKNNYPNMYSSYYTYGGAIALALDLDLRNHFKNVSLDNFMQQLWKQFGKTGKPYTISGLQAALATITNNNYAAGFFTKYVYGHEPFDYKKVIESANLNLLKEAEGKAWAGRINFYNNPVNLVVNGNVVKNTPLYNAGVDMDDILISLDGKNLQQRRDFDKIIEAHNPGDKLLLTYKHRDKTIETTLVLAEDNWLKIEPGQNKITVEQQNFKNAWLGDKAAL